MKITIINIRNTARLKHRPLDLTCTLNLGDTITLDQDSSITIAIGDTHYTITQPQFTINECMFEEIFEINPCFFEVSDDFIDYTLSNSLASSTSEQIQENKTINHISFSLDELSFSSSGSKRGWFLSGDDERMLSKHAIDKLAQEENIKAISTYLREGKQDKRHSTSYDMPDLVEFSKVFDNDKLNFSEEEIIQAARKLDALRQSGLNIRAFDINANENTQQAKFDESTQQAKFGDEISFVANNDANKPTSETTSESTDKTTSESTDENINKTTDESTADNPQQTKFNDDSARIIHNGRYVADDLAEFLYEFSTPPHSNDTSASPRYEQSALDRNKANPNLSSQDIQDMLGEFSVQAFDIAEAEKQVLQIKDDEIIDFAHKLTSGNTKEELAKLEELDAQEQIAQESAQELLKSLAKQQDDDGLLTKDEILSKASSDDEACKANDTDIQGDNMNEQNQVQKSIDITKAIQNITQNDGFELIYDMPAFDFANRQDWAFDS